MNPFRSQWLRQWRPVLPNGINRLEFLLELRAMVDKFSRRQTVWIDNEAVKRILAFGVLNNSQIANLAGISREYVSKLAVASGTEKPISPRGLMDRYQLDMIYLLVQQLSLGRLPNQVFLEQLPDCGDVAIVSFLSGVPKSTINRYREKREHGTGNGQRIVDDDGVYESAIG